jgi:uncharacterized protein (TIGR00251 family)
MAAARATASGIELDVWVSPRASRPGLGPLRGDRLRVAVSAPPVDGEANEAVRAVVAHELAVPRAQVAIARGASGRNKTLAISGDPAALLARAQALCGPAPAEEDGKVPPRTTNNQRKGSNR